jgi:hypothetical protein
MYLKGAIASNAIAEIFIHWHGRYSVANTGCAMMIPSNPKTSTDTHTAHAS